MKKIFAVFLLGISQFVWAGNELYVTVNAKQPIFVIRLAANPTTGFQWSVADYDKDLLHLVSSDYQPNQSKRVGAGGVMFFTFERNKGKVYPASTNILCHYARPWEPESATEKQVQVIFTQ